MDSCFRGNDKSEEIESFSVACSKHLFPEFCSGAVTGLRLIQTDAGSGGRW
jgi:hypothetical protein